MNCSRFAALATCIVSLTFVNVSNAEDVILKWNQVLSEVLLADTDYQNPGMASRSLAMTNIAMYEAINSIQPTHQTLYSQVSGPSNASLDAAALQAGYRVLAEIYPGQQSLLDTRRATILATLPNNDATNDGITVGNAVGNAVVQARANDGFDEMSQYIPSGEIGRWEPDPLNPLQEAWGPQWGSLSPFVIPDTGSMMPPAMPSLTSDAYTHAFDEVKELGALNSATRTADQTEIALFWAYDRLGMGTPMRLYINVLDAIAKEQGNDLETNALLFANATTAVADAGIVAWDAKFQFDFWRPISGIRQADLDGNPDTIADPDWVPLGAPGGTLADGTVINDFTPPFPTYISGHASFGGALFQSIANFYGTDDISFSLQSDEVPGVTRSFSSLSQASMENGRSRVFMGIHWDFDDIYAREAGGLVSDYVMDTAFQPIPEPGGIALIAWAGGLLLLRRRRRSAT